MEFEQLFLETAKKLMADFTKEKDEAWAKNDKEGALQAIEKRNGVEVLVIILTKELLAQNEKTRAFLSEL